MKGSIKFRIYEICNKYEIYDKYEIYNKYVVYHHIEYLQLIA